ncbi:nucleolar RNA-associated family protein [Perkinsela sp. CCAP 1560/4]|nr:nucleolar RNA-associated family protein [Perkinsela sp. CCAP 1560/4]|eukprot:KNH05190.1 nucleolar RNA-associated family protein [Perkinsela sp. CCAP 1560/4]
MKDIGAVDWSKSPALAEMEEAIRDTKKAIMMESANSTLTNESNENIASASFVPSRVAVVGGFLLRTSLQQTNNIDIVAYMPIAWCKALKLDDSNYLKVRSAYVHFLAQHLEANLGKTSKKAGQVVVCSSFGEKTCVRIAFSTRSKFSVHIHTGLGAALLRENDFIEWKLESNPLLEGCSIEAIPDKTYTALNVAEDSFMECVMFAVHSAMKKEKSLIPVIVLLKKWLLVNHWNTVLPSHILSLLVCSIWWNVISTQPGGTQPTVTWETLMRATIKEMSDAEKLEMVLRSIATHSVENQIIGLMGAVESKNQPALLPNIPFTFRINRGQIRDLSRFAQSFNCLLQKTTELPTMKHMHNALCVSPFNEVQRHLSGNAQLSSLVKFCIRHDSVFMIRDIGKLCGKKDPTKFIHELLGTAQLALTDRALQINFHIVSTQRIDEDKTFLGLVHSAFFGVIYGPESSSNTTKCQVNSSNNATSSFQMLWGPQNIGHRRFSDGSIHITRVWKGTSPDGLMLEILRDVWKRHHGVHPALVGNTIAQVDTSVLLEENRLKVLNKSKVHNTAETASNQKTQPRSNCLHHAIGILRNYMYTLHENGFPVKIEDVSCTHPALRGTSVWSPKPHAFLIHTKERKEYDIPYEELERSYHLKTIPVSVELGKHAMWPNDIPAIDQLLSSLGVDISRIMRKQYGVVSVPHPRSVTLIIMGYAFRVELFQKKLADLARASGENTLELKLDVARRLNRAHHTFMMEVVEKHPAAGVAVRVLLRLVRFHLPADALPEEALELLVAKQLCADSHPHHGGLLTQKTVQSPSALVIHTLVFVLAHHWNEAVSLLDSGAEQPRPSKTKFPMHFVTPYSTESPFTQSSPTRENLGELQTFAREVLQRITNQITIPSSFQAYYQRPEVQLRCPGSIVALWKHWEIGRLVGDLETHETRSALRKWRRILFKRYMRFDFVISFRFKLINRQFTEELNLTDDSSSTTTPPGGSTMNIYQKGTKDRAEVLHSMLAFDPVEELLTVVHNAFSDKVKLYHDTFAFTATKHCVHGVFCDAESDEGEKKVILDKIIHLLGDAVYSYHLETA